MARRADHSLKTIQKASYNKRVLKPRSIRASGRRPFRVLPTKRPDIRGVRLKRPLRCRPLTTIFWSHAREKISFSSIELKIRPLPVWLPAHPIASRPPSRYPPGSLGGRTSPRLPASVPDRALPPRTDSASAVQIFHNRKFSPSPLGSSLKNELNGLAEAENAQETKTCIVGFEAQYCENLAAIRILALFFQLLVELRHAGFEA